MGAFLKITSGIYLIFIWAAFFMSVNSMKSAQSALGQNYEPLMFLICIGLSVPAALIYGFGQIVGNIRAARNHLEAMRRYYEPTAVEDVRVTKEPRF